MKPFNKIQISKGKNEVPFFLILLSLFLVTSVTPVFATLLDFNNKYVITSSTPVTTTSTSLGDDTEASQTFSLTASKTVLVIYNAHNADGATEPYYGKSIAISVDGTDYATTWNSPNGTNKANGATTFWIGTLAAGSHTIKGRFASNTDASTATLSERVLLIYVLNGDEFYYTDNDTDSTSASTTLGDDAYASTTFTPTAQCKALILYNVGNSSTPTESLYGKKIAIQLDSTDYSQAEKSPQNSTHPDNLYSPLCIINCRSS